MNILLHLVDLALAEKYDFTWVFELLDADPMVSNNKLRYDFCDKKQYHIDILMQALNKCPTY